MRGCSGIVRFGQLSFRIDNDLVFGAAAQATGERIIGRVIGGQRSRGGARGEMSMGAISRKSDDGGIGADDITDRLGAVDFESAVEP